jgi:NADP-dependent 3-hydroxy acid dehydrogenase YdfG
MVKTDEVAIKRYKDEEGAAKVYADVANPLTADDIAEAVRWSVMLPHHFNVDSLILRPLAQAAQHKVHRVL